MRNQEGRGRMMVLCPPRRCGVPNNQTKNIEEFVAAAVLQNREVD
jgi:hypothetical protein